MLALVAVAGVSLFFNFDEIYTPENNMSTTGGALLVGNVEVVKRDGAGNIVAYRQGSNHIVLGGMELIARQIFGNAGAGNNTNNTLFDDTVPGAERNHAGGVVQYMEIGNGTNNAADDCLTDGGGSNPVLGFDNMTLECPLSGISSPTGDYCLRELADIFRFNATEQPPAASDAAQLNMTAVATFSGSLPDSCAANNIGEAGLWTNASTGPAFYTNNTGDYLTNNLMFARNTFGTVNLSTSDSLELTWKFTFTDN